MPTHRSGRPTTLESRRRRREFVRLLADGRGWRESAERARVKPESVLGMLDTPEFAALARELLEEVPAA